MSGNRAMSVKGPGELGTIITISDMPDIPEDNVLIVQSDDEQLQEKILNSVVYGKYV